MALRENIRMFLVQKVIHSSCGIKSVTFTFTFMHLADAFIQSDLQCIQVTVFFFYI